MGYIYKITNTLNGKAYIGETKQDDVQKRWNAHKKSIKYNNGCPLLTQAFNKYGIDKFKFEVLIICFNDACFELEKYYIKKYNTFGENGYNGTPGGEGGGAFRGRKHTPENVQKIKERSREYYKSEENRQKLSNILKQKYKTDPSYREKISQAQKERVRQNIHNLQHKNNNGTIIKRKYAQEIKEKISKSLLKYYQTNTPEKHKMRENVKQKMSEKTIARIGRPVYKISPEKNIIGIYMCIKEAADKTGIPRSSIQAAANGRMTIAGGFGWKYADMFATVNSFFKKQPKDS